MEEWRPDWTQEGQYEHIKSLNWTGLAWEFLRRNEKYCGDWHSLTRKDVLTNEARTKAQKWGLSKMCDPATASVDGLWLKSRFARRLSRARNRENAAYLDLNAEDKLGYGFDLTKPIKPQLDAVRDDLKRRQKALKSSGVPIVSTLGNNLGEFPLYIRILDASASKALHSKIIETIDEYRALDPHGPERLKDNLRTARGFMKNGYQGLLLRA